MKRYVDADKMIEDTEAMRAISDAIMIDGITKYINENATTDVEEIRHGEWVHGREMHREYIGDALINIYYENFTCSCCGYLIDDEYYSRIFYKRCPECGAKMGGMEKEI